MKLFDVPKEYEELVYQLEDEEITEEEFYQKLDELKDIFDKKVEFLAMLIRNEQAELEMVKQEKDAFAKRQKSLQNKIDQKKTYLMECMREAGVKRVSGVLRVTLSQRKDSKVIVDNEARIPDAFMTVKTEVKPNLTAIKNALKENGEIVDGIHFEDTYLLLIR